MHVIHHDTQSSVVITVRSTLIVYLRYLSGFLSCIGNFNGHGNHILSTEQTKISSTKTVKRGKSS